MNKPKHLKHEHKVKITNTKNFDDLEDENLLLEIKLHKENFFIRLMFYASIFILVMQSIIIYLDGGNIWNFFQIFIWIFIFFYTFNRLKFDKNKFIEGKL